MDTVEPWCHLGASYRGNVRRQWRVHGKRVPCGRYVHIGESHRGYLGTGSVDFGALFRALAAADYRGPLTFESFSSAVVSPSLSNTLCVWRNLCAPWRAAPWSAAATVFAYQLESRRCVAHPGRRTAAAPQGTADAACAPQTRTHVMAGCGSCVAKYAFTCAAPVPSAGGVRFLSQSHYFCVLCLVLCDAWHAAAL